MNSIPYSGITWVGIAFRDSSGKLTAIEMDNDNFLRMEMIQEFDPVGEWDLLDYYSPRSAPPRVKMEIEARGFRMWQQGADAATEPAQLEIEGSNSQ